MVQAIPENIRTSPPSSTCGYIARYVRTCAGLLYVANQHLREVSHISQLN